MYDSESGYGFSDVDYNTAPKGWDGSVYYPRTANVSASAASYVRDEDDMLAIDSKVWTETESTGYGYTHMKIHPHLTWMYTMRIIRLK